MTKTDGLSTLFHLRPKTYCNKDLFSGQIRYFFFAILFCICKYVTLCSWVQSCDNIEMLPPPCSGAKLIFALVCVGRYVLCLTRVKVKTISFRVVFELFLSLRQWISCQKRRKKARAKKKITLHELRYQSNPNTMATNREGKKKEKFSQYYSTNIVWNFILHVPGKHAPAQFRNRANEKRS